MIAVAALGDFRSRAPHMPQWAGLTLLCCHLAAKYRISPLSVVGHDEIPGGSSDPDKQCPGRYLNMDFLRKSIDSDWLPR
jgi:N-acetyl-anhydromuramyl-L-alanine amidase AmpD